MTHVTSTINFKLKSEQNLKTIRFDGKTIKARDARVLIAARIGCSDLEIDLYRGDALLNGEEDLVASTQIEVMRKQVQLRGKPVSQIQKDAMQKEEKLRIFGAAGGGGADAKPTVVGGENVSEEERIAMLNAVTGRENANTTGAGPGRKFFGGRGGADLGAGGVPQRAPPPGYVCHACGKAGHFIEHCPDSNRMEGKRFALPVGIAESSLEIVPAGDPTAKYITKDGRWVRPRIDGSNFVARAAVDESAAPAELRCPLCDRLLDTALRLRCCGAVMCSSCLDKLGEKAAASDDGPPACAKCGEPIMLDECDEAADVRAKCASWRSTASGKRPRDVPFDREALAQDTG
jgi:hypothetical protein